MFQQEKSLFSTVIINVWVLLFLNGCTDSQNATHEQNISFNRDIRPILNEHCTGCHGGVGKQSGVSFIVREEALGRGHSGRLTVVPGNPDASGLIERIESKDPNIRMPYKAPALEPKKIALLRQWIEEGAHWEEHWAFESPKKQTPPNIVSGNINNPIDNFVLAKIQERGLSMSPQADKATLLRRLSFDLIGMPPTIEELNSFLLDNSPNAYEKQIERLLASKRFGERWASMWLDLSRYADSKGYTKDQYRPTWPFRDWVIDAFNQDKSYKDFVVEQLAGDLLPKRTIENMIATGFHRQTPINNEGGTDDEEFRVVAMLDRVSTTWSVLNGITMNCVQCHSHPYDPIFHDEFYKFYSFLNTTKDADKDNDTPLLKFADSPSKRNEAFELQEQTLKIKNLITKQAVDANQKTTWHKLPIVTGKIDELAALKIKHKELSLQLNQLEKNNWKYNQTKQKIDNINKSITTLTDVDLKELGLKNNEVYETSEGLAPIAIYKITAQNNLSSPKKVQAIRFMVAGLNPDKSPHTPEFAYNIDNIEAWHVAKDGEEIRLGFSSFLANSTEVIDKQLSKLNSIHTLRIKQGNTETTPLTNEDNMGTAVSLFGQRLFNPRWSVGVLAQPITLAQGDTIRINVSRFQGTSLNGQPSKLRHLKIDTTDDKRWAHLAQDPSRISNIKEFVALKRQLNKIKTIDMPVMYEQDAWDKRGTALFGRGNFLAKEGKLLTPDTPAIFPAFPNDKEKNRLSMAEWFFSPEQPLTSRVAVNRFWHALFGRGIVETLEDFGSIGAKPSHPELLDWLALEFSQNLDWSVKRLLHLMVSSSAYQQQANASVDEHEKDPSNVWLTRGPKQRLTAEMIRDQALLASDLLSTKMGGMGVMPPQPDKIWGRKGTNIKDWKNAVGEDRYRRSIYTFIKRQYTYPSFITFDMESRELSHARRIPTNTPLQALVTLNDPVYHEAAQALAKLMLTHYQAVKNQSNGLEQAINIGFQRVNSHKVNQKQLLVISNALDNAMNEVGNDKSLEAWTAVASILYNLDTALTR